MDGSWVSYKGNWFLLPSSKVSEVGVHDIELSSSAKRSRVCQVLRLIFLKSFVFPPTRC